MLSPLLPLNPPDMAWNADECLDDGDFWSDDDDDGDVESFRVNGKGSTTMGVWFRLRSAIFEDCGTGITGIGRMRLDSSLSPSLSLSSELFPATGNATGICVAGRVEPGNLLRLFFRCDVVSCWILSSSIAELIHVSVVISNRLDRRRLLLWLLRRRKYFWAWLATWVGVRVFTKFLEIPLQSPFPTFCKPNKNSLCSSSVHGTPLLRSWLLPEAWTTSSEAYPAATSGLESWGCSYWARLFMLALFLNDPSVSRTPNNMMPPLLPPPLTAAAQPLESEQVRELWPLFPQCEHTRDMIVGVVVHRKEEWLSEDDSQII